MGWWVPKSGMVGDDDAHAVFGTRPTCAALPVVVLFGGISVTLQPGSSLQVLCGSLPVQMC